MVKSQLFYARFNEECTVMEKCGRQIKGYKVSIVNWEKFNGVCLDSPLHFVFRDKNAPFLQIEEGHFSPERPRITFRGEAWMECPRERPISPIFQNSFCLKYSRYHILEYHVLNPINSIFTLLHMSSWCIKVISV